MSTSNPPTAVSKMIKEIKALNSVGAYHIMELLRELSSELDLHYEDTDMPHLFPTMKKIEAAVTQLENDGFDIPEVVTHILKRYHRHHN